jgi:hypothetical protein
MKNIRESILEVFKVPQFITHPVTSLFMYHMFEIMGLPEKEKEVKLSDVEKELEQMENEGILKSQRKAVNIRHFEDDEEIPTLPKKQRFYSKNRDRVTS